MPPAPSRRTFLRAGSLAIGTIVAGCATTTPADTDRTTTTRPAATIDDTGTYATAPDGPEDYPDRPEELGRSSVTAYTRSYEHARVYNSLHESDAETVSVHCEATYDTAADGGHYALATCGGYADYADGIHADHGQLPAVYFVSDGLTVRVEEVPLQVRNFEEVFASNDPGENVQQPGEGSPTGYRVYNVDPSEHVLSVAVEFLGGDDPVEVFSTEHRLPAASGLQQGSVTFRAGEYRIAARLDEGRRTSARWTVEAGEAYRRRYTSIVVAPTGRLSIRRPAFDELPM